MVSNYKKIKNQEFLTFVLIYPIFLSDSLSREQSYKELVHQAKFFVTCRGGGNGPVMPGNL